MTNDRIVKEYAMKRLILVLFGLTALNTYADVTQGALQNNPALCAYGYNTNCGGNAGSYTPQVRVEHITINHPPKFGALALNTKTRHLAGALNKDTLEEAKREAINFCKQGSGDKNCKVVQWSQNGCVAAAEGKLGNKFHLVAGAGKVGEAEREALTGCRNNGAKNCKIIMPEGCSLPQ